MSEQQTYNNPPTFEKIIKTLLYIFLIASATYAVMAVITHFSLNYMLDDYTFTQSITAIFDTQTAIFKFFRLFSLFEVGVVCFALLTKLIKEKLI